MTEKELIDKFTLFSKKMSVLRMEMGEAFSGLTDGSEGSISLGKAVLDFSVESLNLDDLVSMICDRFKLSLDYYKTISRKLL